MSEKRFEVENERTVYDNLLHRGFVCSWKVDAQELVGLLNSLYDENEQLQRECKSNEHLCEYYRQKYKKLLEDVQENVKGELVIR